MFSYISNLFKPVNKNDIMQKILDNESLTCKDCNNIAYPVWGTSNKYKCTVCSKRFTNSHHNLIKKALNEFNITTMTYSKTKENSLKQIYEKCIEQ